MSLQDELNSIHQGLTQARAHLARLEQALAALEAAGMYPSVPSEQWQSRNGSEPVYLYMLFRWDNMKGGYAGPGGKQKTYVGNKPERIEEARRLAKNRERWEKLDSTRTRLRAWISAREYDVRHLAREAAGWPRLDGQLWQQLELGQVAELGQDHGAAIAPERPKTAPLKSGRHYCDRCAMITTWNNGRCGRCRSNDFDNEVLRADISRLGQRPAGS